MNIDFNKMEVNELHNMGIKYSTALKKCEKDPSHCQRQCSGYATGNKIVLYLRYSLFRASD